MHEMYRNTYNEKHITLLAFNLFHLHIFLKYELLFTYRDISNMTHCRFCLNTFIPQFVYTMFENSFYISLLSKSIPEHFLVFNYT